MAQPRLPGTGNLLDLPRELRDEIYQFALVNEDHIVFSGHLLDPKWGRDTRIMRDPHESGTETLYTTTTRQDERGFGLLRTCRQIHAEIGALLYKRNQFCFPDMSLSYHAHLESDQADGRDTEQEDRHLLYRRDLSGCLSRKFGPSVSYVQKLTLVLEKFEFCGRFLDGAYTFLWHDTNSGYNRGEVGEICSAVTGLIPRLKSLTIAWQVADVCLVCHQWTALFRRDSARRDLPLAEPQEGDAADEHVGDICDQLLYTQGQDLLPMNIPSIVQFQFLMLHKGPNLKGCSCCLCCKTCESLDPDILNKIVQRLRHMPREAGQMVVE